MEVSDKDIVLRLTNVTKKYGSKTAVKDLNISAYKGDIYGFLGPNGSGKTTTIRMITGLIRPNRGSIEIGGYNLHYSFKKAIKHVGAIVENPVFYDYLSGLDNLKLIRNLCPGLERGRIDEVLEIVGLTEDKKRKVKTYSLGMRQRLGIAAALLNNPKIVILDEPTNGLDPESVQMLREFIRKLAGKNGITFFISSHILKEIEGLCNRVGILNNGQLVVEGYVEELLSDTFDLFEIGTLDIEDVYSELSKLDYVKSIDIRSKSLVVRAENGHMAQINALLVSKGLRIEYVSPKRKSLESYFFDVTKGGMS